MADKLSIGIDIGGTNIAAGIVDEDGRILASANRPTPSTDPNDVLEAIGDLSDELRSQHHVRSIGVGAAGFVDASQSTVLFSPHLAWRYEPLRDAVARRTRLPVLVDNDANAAGWAEARFGAAQNVPDLVLITLGTGIGGALVIDGQPYRGHSGIAGEFGHMQVVADGLPCECGNHGCWEQYASGRVLERRVRQALDDDEPIASRLRRLAGDEPVSGTHATRLAKDNDADALSWITDIGQWLGTGISNLAAALDPSAFVVGGGVSEAGELLLGPAREIFRRSLTGRGFRAEAGIVNAHLGAEAGLIGAADMARIRARRRRQANPGGRARVRGAERSARQHRRQR